MADPKRVQPSDRRERGLGERRAPIPARKGKSIVIAKARKFVSEIRTEMQKVTWSTREELIGSTGVVLMTMLILSVFIGVADFVLSQLMSFVLR